MYFKLSLPKLAKWQGFPQVLRIWRGALRNLIGGELKSLHGESMGEGGRELKMLLKNTCEEVHLIVKSPSICLQACKFAKNEPLHTYFSRVLAIIVAIV